LIGVLVCRCRSGGPYQEQSSQKTKASLHNMAARADTCSGHFQPPIFAPRNTTAELLSVKNSVLSERLSTNFPLIPGCSGFDSCPRALTLPAAPRHARACSARHARACSARHARACSA
jgi:hypothetical protein